MATSAELRAKLASIIISPNDDRGRYTNWARSYTSLPATAFQPTNAEQCADILRLGAREGQIVRAVGCGHSPSDLPCTSGFMIRTDRMNQLLEVNREKDFIVVESGALLSDLNLQLASYGLAFSNLGSISASTVGGVVSTATHGSGIMHGCIATQVLALDLMLADTTILHCSRSENSHYFHASLCGLGATGLILRVTIKVEPAFRLREVRKSMGIDQCIENLSSIASGGEYVRLWWSPQTDQVLVMTADRTTNTEVSKGSWFWETFYAGMLAEFIMFIGLVIPWFEFIANVMRSNATIVSETLFGTSDEIFNVDCGFVQYTTEWSVPMSEAQETLRQVKDWVARERADPSGVRPSMPIEIRFSAPDDIWLSPGYERTSCWIGIVKYKPFAFATPFSDLSQGFENIVRRHNGRPHWAKTHGFSPSGLRSLYPRFDDFVRLVRTIDPNGMFRNEYLRRHLLEETGYAVDTRTFAKDV